MLYILNFYLLRILTNLTILFILKFYLCNVLNKLIFYLKYLNNLETFIFHFLIYLIFWPT